MKYYLPIHINGGNRGCEAITKDVAMAAFTAVTQGIIVTGVSAYAKQIISRMSKK